MHKVLQGTPKNICFLPRQERSAANTARRFAREQDFLVIKCLNCKVWVLCRAATMSAYAVVGAVQSCCIWFYLAGDFLSEGCSL
jgi:hypothetical protein